MFIELVYDHKVNYAAYLNKVKVIKEIVLTNNSDVVYQNVVITVESVPEFAYPLTIHLNKLTGGESIVVDTVDFTMSSHFLASLTECLSGEIIVKVSSLEQVIMTGTYPIDLLSFDQWGGTGVLPSLLASFITPNHPYIRTIISKASVLLEGGFSAYQTLDPKVVTNQVLAIYNTIRNEQIAYSVPPASFEATGQKVRLAHEIAKYKLATCLDISLLFASCLEAVGIHPLVVLLDGHAIVGFWVTEQTFSEAYIDDVTALTKRISFGISDICLIEAVAINKGQDVSFESAIFLANQHVSEHSNFNYLIDVKRSRTMGIKPLPLLIDEEEGRFVIKESSQELKNQGLMFDINHNIIQIDENSQSKKMTRIDVWQRKLLDLSLRNQLINFRINSAMHVPIYTYDLHELENEMAKGMDFSIYPRPEHWSNNDKDHLKFIQNLVVDERVELLREDFKQNRLRSSLNEVDLKRVLTKLYRSSRSHIEETGSNALYLSVGMLMWYESKSSSLPRYAPIVLIPIDIIRKSVKNGYVIRLSDDEAQINISLLEMLRQDSNITFPELSRLPVDEHGLDIDKILTIFRRKILDEANWDVFDVSYLSIFTFNKFVMYNDIKNKQDVLGRSPIVQALIDNQVFKMGENQLSEGLLDEQAEKHQIVCPLSYDSSQLSAIIESNNAKSFILYGPPGTGKSQTITNMIVNALGKGKRVLFVAEKMAALNVVQNRLEKLGLAPFCLELHSNKSRKKQVLEKLKHTLELKNAYNQIDFNQANQEVSALKKELSDQVFEMNKESQFGVSVYEAIGTYLSLGQTKEIPQFEQAYCCTLKKQALDEVKQNIHELSVFAKANDPIVDHPLLPVYGTSYTTSLKTTAHTKIQDLLESSYDLESLGHITQLIKLTPPVTLEDYKNLTNIITLLQKQPKAPNTLFIDQSFDDTAFRILDLVEEAKVWVQERDTMRQVYQDSVLDLDLEGVFNHYQKMQKKWFLTRLLTSRKVKALLKPHIRFGLKLKSKKLSDDLLQLISCQDKCNKLMPYQDMLVNYLGQNYTDEAFDDCVNHVNWLIELRKGYLSYLVSLSDFQSVQAAVYAMLNERKTFDLGLDDYVLTYQKFADLVNEVNALLTIKDSHFELTSPSPMTIYQSRLGLILSHLDDLREWSLYVGSKERVKSSGFHAIVESIENGSLSVHEMELAFTKSLSKSIVDHLVAQSPILSQFSRMLFEDKVERFKELDEKLAKLVAEEVYSYLSQSVPNGSITATANSELGILQKAARGGGRGLSLRSLFDKIPHLLPMLTPCLLMSPLSVAQYLELGEPQFDLLIFDEASQMLTCDAIGAMARAKNVIVVGDPKQLPPTTFFNSNQDNLEQDIELSDLDSILDDCLALNMPYKHLLWHYRSRHESLISFSNTKYYDNHLLTFPSPDDLSSKVTFEYVEGFYDRGGTRQNHQEATAVVNDLFRRLGDPALNYRSIGIVTFNTVQQALIEDLIDERLRTDTQYEEYFNGTHEESVFVKNLENVQGDERDVILFSVGYGPDKTGRISVNFGPLNQEGGFRRLNVAITRSRYEMKVFSSLLYHQIDLSKTNARGVQDFRSFLEYAQRNTTLVVKDTDKLLLMEDSFVEELASDLRQRGHHIVTSIGDSQYKISIGIVNPKNSNEYILGIECDGGYYKDASTIRDREVLRKSVLMGLGWSIIRVYALDYYDQQEKELNRIERMIEDALTKKHELINKKEAISFNNSHLVYVDKSTSHSETYTITPVDTQYDSDCFYQAAYRPIVHQAINQIIETEGPIGISLLYKRVLSYFGMNRMGSLIKSILKESLDKSLRNEDMEIHKYDYETFIMKRNQKMTHYRIAKTGDEKRSIKDIDVIEILIAIKEVLSNQIGMPKEDLYKETSKLFGFQKLGNQLIDILSFTIDHGIREGILREQDGQIYLM